MHIGNARTALFNWLFARANKGSFVLRIEDTDIARSVDKYVKKIIDDLRWLGLDWDEGPDRGGPYAPYKQSERIEIYKRFADKLLKEDKAYHCYCSQSQLEKKRAEAIKEGKPPRYDNRCRNLSKEEIENFKKRKIRPAVRFKVPSKILVVNDILRGEVGFDTSLIGDFVIMKSMGSPSFNFAVVCDDAAMEISHVIRGEDHLPNTPKHALLFEALGFKQPLFCHMSLTTSPGGDRLSKRTKATSIEYYRKAGYLPEALVNYIALLGWSPGDDREILSRQELIGEFDLKRLSRSSEAFDPEKLDWIGGVYIRNADVDRLTRLAVPYLKRGRFIKGGLGKAEFETLKSIVSVVRDHLSCMSEINDHVGIFFLDKFAIKDKEAKAVLEDERSKEVLRAFQERLKNVDKIDEGTFKDLIKEVEKKTDLKGKGLYQPIRIAITGQLHGPELRLIVPILGKERCIRRVKRVLKGV